MPRLTVADGVEIHYEDRGTGPLVVISSYWSMHPSALEPMINELASDHRVIRYDDRGTGASTRTGPYDLDTAAADLAAVIAAQAEPAVILGVADGPARAVRVATKHPELVTAVVCNGGPPVGRRNFAGEGGMVSSDAVVDALLKQVETDYRGALRTLVGSTNQQMSEQELRDRIADQAGHVPAEAGAARLRAWAGDDALEYARATGDRLWVLVSDSLTGGWFPTGRELASVVERLLPQAHIGEVADGWVSRPDECAAFVRRITAGARAALR